MKTFNIHVEFFEIWLVHSVVETGFGLLLTRCEEWVKLCDLHAAINPPTDIAATTSIHGGTQCRVC